MQPFHVPHTVAVAFAAQFPTINDAALAARAEFGTTPREFLRSLEDRTRMTPEECELFLELYQRPCDAARALGITPNRFKMMRRKRTTKGSCTQEPKGRVRSGASKRLGRPIKLPHSVAVRITEAQAIEMGSSAREWQRSKEDPKRLTPQEAQAYLEGFANESLAAEALGVSVEQFRRMRLMRT